MIRNTPALTFSSYLSMFFLGVGASVIGAAARNIGLTPYEIGLLVAIQNLGFMVAVAVSGALADTFEKPRILMVGSAIFSLALFSFYLSELFWINLCLMFLIGAGMGAYEGVTDAMLLDLHPGRESFYINVNHLFVTLGSLAIAIYLIFLQMNWRFSTVQAAAALLALAVFFGLARLQHKVRRSEPLLGQLRILSRDRAVVALFLATALVVGVEAGFVGTLTTFLMDMRGFTQITSKIGLVLFMVGMAGGRLCIGYFMPQDQALPTLLALLGLSAVCFTALLFFDAGVFIYAVIFLAGVAMSALIPLVLTLAGLLYRDQAGTVLGAVKVAIPIGGITLPFLMSLSARFTSFQASLMLLPLGFLLAFGLLVLYLRHMRVLRAAPLAAAAD
jgi:fucose permease